MDDSDLGILSSDEEPTTAAKVLNLLTAAWVNEKHSPTLLKHESDLVDCMMDQIHQMEENLQNLNHDDFRLVPHQMEVDRIRYIISSYLRTRLEKIESFTAHLLKRDRATIDEDDRVMSKGEFEFAETFLNNLKTHFHHSALKYMPNILQDFGEGVAAQEVKPNLNSSVFIRMVKTVNNALICDQPSDLMAGSRHLLPYKDVMEYIHNGSAFLI